MTEPLSDFDRMLKVRLPNWGFWSREDRDRPDPESGAGSIYRLGKKDETERDPDAAPEEVRKVDPKDCEHLDRLIGCDDPLGMLPPHKRGKIAAEHRHVIVNFFYKRRESYWPRVHAAVRALLDAEEAMG